MTAGALHLAIVHLPILGVPAVFVWLLVGEVRLARASQRPSESEAIERAEGWLRFGYWLLLGVTATAAAAYFTGPPTYEGLEVLYGEAIQADEPWIEQHALLARAAFFSLLVTAALTFQASLAYLQEEAPGPWLRRSILVLLLGVAVLLVWGAHVGGQIRRPELRSTEGAPLQSLYPVELPRAHRVG